MQKLGKKIFVLKSFLRLIQGKNVAVNIFLLFLISEAEHILLQCSRLGVAALHNQSGVIQI